MLAVTAIIVVVFLIHLNGFLRGRLEGYIDAFLSVCCVTLIVMVFWLQGWRIGLAWVVGSLLLGYVLKPLARVVAGFLLR